MIFHPLNLIPKNVGNRLNGKNNLDIYIQMGKLQMKSFNSYKTDLDHIGNYIKCHEHLLILWKRKKINKEIFCKLNEYLCNKLVLTTFGG